ncbi:UNVERIFIED_ORG: hypothetical protein J2Y81_007924 [Paraburkholderia sediminicola]|nr:hypothetical protein [Paraburkholderia sediminicola]
MNVKAVTTRVKKPAECEVELLPGGQMSKESGVVTPITNDLCSMWARANATGGYDWMDWNPPFLSTE